MGKDHKKITDPVMEITDAVIQSTVGLKEAAELYTDIAGRVEKKPSGESCKYLKTAKHSFNTATAISSLTLNTAIDLTERMPSATEKVLRNQFGKIQEEQVKMVATAHGATAPAHKKCEAFSP